MTLPAKIKLIRLGGAKRLTHGQDGVGAEINTAHKPLG